MRGPAGIVGTEPRPTLFNSSEVPMFLDRFLNLNALRRDPAGEQRKAELHDEYVKLLRAMTIAKSLEARRTILEIERTTLEIRRLEGGER